ncbi:plasmid partitioning protein RepB [Allorhizobium sp. BGMRC 0089]|uniref:plasmid partitioning protein RepB n=1 Tax=Allorhizobium sonneratiae TaxID=2934936 RepID=UPI0020333A71|nr:plasmid partitioning protein RepB [Allorhizobium sonneratiae]MCM2292685.1 plasmid partitioning protein RepB [Allorhizobium sonneratiae]
MSRKDSRGMFANVLGQMQQSEQAAHAPAQSQSPHLKKVADGIRQMKERGDILDRLLKEGDRIVELDPAIIAPSAIRDRFDSGYDDAALDEIRQSMRAQGQIVPGLVRPVEGGSMPFQIVYGRRRLAVARELGLAFRAIVKELSDEQAIIYQGEENTNRDDLTFIEKCSFAAAQEQAGFRRDVICASLSTGKSHVSEMIRIAASVPAEILHLIGRSPQTGRRRWIEFVETWLQSEDGMDKIRHVLDNASARDGAKDVDRFALALHALRTAKPATQGPASASRDIRTGGLVIGTLAHGKAGSKISFSKAVSADFVEFLGEKLPELHRQFCEEKEKG